VARFRPAAPSSVFEATASLPAASLLRSINRGEYFCYYHVPRINQSTLELRARVQVTECSVFSGLSRGTVPSLTELGLQLTSAVATAVGL